MVKITFFQDLVGRSLLVLTTVVVGFYTFKCKMVSLLPSFEINDFPRCCGSKSVLSVSELRLGSMTSIRFLVRC